MLFCLPVASYWDRKVAPTRCLDTNQYLAFNFYAGGQFPLHRHFSFQRVFVRVLILTNAKQYILHYSTFTWPFTRRLHFAVCLLSV